MSTDNGLIYLFLTALSFSLCVHPIARDLDSEAMSSAHLPQSFALLAQMRNHFRLALFAEFLIGVHPLAAQATALPSVGDGWPTYVVDAGGLRFSSLPSSPQ